MIGRHGFRTGRWRHCHWGREEGACAPRAGRLYRSRNGFILGVCRGIADYFEVPVFWVRAGALMLLFLTGLWPVAGIYLAAAFLLPLEPVLPPENEEEKDFYDSYASSPKATLRSLKRQFDSVERRIRRMEDTVTSREYEWERKLKG